VHWITSKSTSAVDEVFVAVANNKGVVDGLVLVRHVQNLLLLDTASALALLALQHIDVAYCCFAALVAAVAQHQCLLVELAGVQVGPYVYRCG